MCQLNVECNRVVQSQNALNYRVAGIEGQNATKGAIIATAVDNVVTEVPNAP